MEQPAEPRPESGSAPESGAEPTNWQRFLSLSGAVALIEAALVLLYAIGILIAAPNSEGATESNALVEALIFAVFAVLIGLIAKSLLARRLTGRPAFILTQIFVLIIAWTVFVGDGVWLKVVGIVLALLGIAGLVFVIASIVKQPVPED